MFFGGPFCSAARLFEVAVSRIKTLRTLFFFALVISLSLPVYNLLVVHPASRDQLFLNAEEDAVRFGKFLIRALALEGEVIGRGRIDPDIIERAARFGEDPLLVKLRLFSPGGEIIFSTDDEEIGRVNREPYFTEKVAKGGIFSKLIRRDALTADGVRAVVDVVETYVPLMSGGQFNGAIEVYYDVTYRSAEVDRLFYRSSVVLLLLSAALFASLLYALRHAKISFESQQEAEDALRRTNAELEERVAGRTRELSRVNLKLREEIDDHSKAREALSEALSRVEEDKEKIDAILRSVAEGLILVDRDERVILMNPAAREMLGICIDGSGIILSAALEKETLPPDILDLLRQGGGREVSIQGSSGPKIIQAATSVIIDRSKRRIGTLAVLHDRTREREIERMKSEFISMAAHELQTPLTAILGFSELLTGSTKGDFTPQEQQEFLSYIQEKAEALSRIVRDLLDISRAEAGAAPSLQRSSFRMTRLMGRMVAQYRRCYPGHRFELSLDAPQIDLEADPDRIAQILENLLSNAVKYSDGGLIRVTGEVCEGFYLVRVIDQGIGMTPAEKSRIFERFFRADNSNTAVPGIGLGMNVVRYLVEAHGGEIFVESEPGRGTSVSFTLPMPREERKAGSA